MNRTLLTWALIISCINLTYAANNLTSKTQELQQVTKQIQGLRHSISDAKNRQVMLSSDLRKIEINVGKIASNLKKTKAKLQNQDVILNQLLQQQNQYQTDLERQQKTLAQTIRAAYMLGRHEYVKLLLNQKDPSKVSRIVEYYKYITQAKLQALNELSETINKIEANKSQISDHTDKLQALVDNQRHEQQRLEKELHKRENILKEVRSNIDTKSQKLNQLVNNKKALESLITRLKQQSQPVVQPTEPFNEMRGKLIWPVKGELTIPFGSHIDNTQLIDTGIFISAKEGENIRAVFPGKVVFADWLRGLGLLIIIEHGNGFMTLYGHCHSLFEKTGDYVKAGQVIASVGKSGGYEKSGLYFQLRDKGKPLNPVNWLKR